MSTSARLSDAQGLPLTAPSRAAVEAYDQTVEGYLTYRADTPKRLERLMALAPDMAMAQILKGYLMMLAFKLAAVPVARTALAAAGPLMANASDRERAHQAGLTAWIAGDVERTLQIWEDIMIAHPRDVLAFRLHHFTAFWLGSADRMGRAVEGVLPAYAKDEPVYAALLACKAFAFEELGRFDEAELAGRDSIARNPADLWAAHAVAHILEMQGRADDGIALLNQLEPHWEGGNNLLHHLWWHRGLYHFERGEFDQVLSLYDSRFRNLSGPLTIATPDLYIDVQNAASMLFRLERQGIDVGQRWNELADKAEARIGDCLSTFTLPHWMMALAATRRWAAADRMLDAMREIASKSEGTVPLLVRDHALPVCAAIVARAKGDPAGALTLMRPALQGMEKLGGSHAQQDVLQQLFLDCAKTAQSAPDAHRVIEHVRKLYAVPPERRRGYALA
jgi:tetratricopeptide (TPR) repeat protein